MNTHRLLKLTAQVTAAIFLLLAANAASADDVLGYLTDQDGKAITKYSGPTVEDNIAKMDTDKNGFADVFEVRAFLELKHGKGYEKGLLDRWEAAARGTSCTTPFAKELYVDKSN